jgi:hypothetical protein
MRGENPLSTLLESGAPHDWHIAPAAVIFPQRLHLITFAPHFRQFVLGSVSLFFQLDNDDGLQDKTC